MADLLPRYEYRTLRIPRGTDIDGAIAELHVGEDGLVTADIRISARQVPSEEDRIRGAMAEAQDHPGRTVTR